MRKRFVAGNWKMNMTLEPARRLVADLRQQVDHVEDVDVLICPPFPLLFPMAKAVDGSVIGLGAQDAHFMEDGAFTGEVSAAMVKDTGATYVIIGHSERRHLFGENDDLIARKVRAVLKEDLHCILCVGETLEQREAGTTDRVVTGQLTAVLDRELPPTRLTVAYEPVWAIGTGKTASPDQAQDVHARIRGILVDLYGRASAGEVRILYGGSVKPGNAAELMSRVDIDGALVGGASLAADDFAAIITAGT